jgi:hypothetical protein
VLTFDRPLLPFSVTRQSLALRDAFNQAPLSPIVIYDPVTLTVTISNPSPGQSWLLEDQPYKVILPVPKDANDIGGLRAIDNATLDHTYVVEFFTGGVPRAFTPDVPKDRDNGALDRPAPFRPTYCGDVRPIFDSHCGTAGGCHNATDKDDAGAYPPMGMLLTTDVGIRNTAIGRVSEQMNRAASSSPLAPGKRFGENMPIIDPGNPGNSYLVYKFLAHGPATSPAITDDEAARLRSLIAGQAMPPPFIFRPSESNNLSSPLNVDDAKTIATWIAQGAAVNDCQ